MDHGGLLASPGGPLRGDVHAPGDKSISHRALILGAMARGTTRVTGLLASADVLHTARAMRLFGATVSQLDDNDWRVDGVGVLREPSDVIDCGNAGTGVRLIMGAAAGSTLSATFTGDSSLRGRPMMRVLAPLGQMGTTWICREGGRLPLTLRGGELTGISYRLPQPSAQVKSAVLLAGLNADGVTVVIEPQRTRDHTERMLRAFGATVGVTECEEGRVITIDGGQPLSGAHVRVPGDPSSAAFPLVAALITPGSEVRVRGVLLNRLRTGLFETLIEMGADLTISDMRVEGDEEVGDVTARHCQMTGVATPPERAAAMIDEYPILAVAAAFARGPTVMRGIGELRVKESDRIAAMATALSASGVTVEEEPDGLLVMGASGDPREVPGGGAIATHGDHRVAMSNLILGLASRDPVRVDDAAMIATSFPGFVELMSGLGADLREA
jgi:3-phosphoshikimate 1-carboxyvinyltransferase